MYFRTVARKLLSKHSRRLLVALMIDILKGYYQEKIQIQPFLDDRGRFVLIRRSGVIIFSICIFKSYKSYTNL